jgi:hypothetical protein
MFGFIYSLLTGIVVMNVGMVWLESLASEQRRLRIEVDPSNENDSA